MCLASSAPPWEPTSTRQGLEASETHDDDNDNDDDDEEDTNGKHGDTCGPVQLAEWFLQAFSRLTLAQQSHATDGFGAALLALDARATTASSADQEDLPLRKIASATSTMTDVSRTSNNTKHQHSSPEARTLEPRMPQSSENALQSAWSEWAVPGAILAVLVGRVLLEGGDASATRLLLFVGFEKPFLLWLARFFANMLPNRLYSSPTAWHARFSDEVCLRFLLSRGWPRVLILWSVMEWLCVLFLPHSTLGLSLYLSIVAFAAGVMETLRRLVLGMALHSLLYRRFCNKVQRTLQRVCVVRSIARFARVPIRDHRAVPDEPETRSGPVNLKELAAFQKAYAALRSDRALSPEFGAVGRKNDLKASAGNLHDAIAVQGRVRLATLEEALIGNETIVSLVQIMFPSASSGVVSQADFIASVEALHDSVHWLLKAIDDE